MGELGGYLVRLLTHNIRRGCAKDLAKLPPDVMKVHNNSVASAMGKDDAAQAAAYYHDEDEALNRHKMVPPVTAIDKRIKTLDGEYVRMRRSDRSQEIDQFVKSRPDDVAKIADSYVKYQQQVDYTRKVRPSTEPIDFYCLPLPNKDSPLFFQCQRIRLRIGRIIKEMDFDNWGEAAAASSSAVETFSKRSIRMDNTVATLPSIPVSKSSRPLPASASATSVIQSNPSTVATPPSYIQQFTFRPPQNPVTSMEKVLAGRSLLKEPESLPLDPRLESGNWTFTADDFELDSSDVLEGDTLIPDMGANEEVDSDVEAEADPNTFWNTLQDRVTVEYDPSKDAIARKAQDDFLIQASLGMVMQDLQQEFEGDVPAELGDILRCQPVAWVQLLSTYNVVLDSRATYVQGLGHPYPGVVGRRHTRDPPTLFLIACQDLPDLLFNDRWSYERHRERCLVRAEASANKPLPKRKNRLPSAKVLETCPQPGCDKTVAVHSMRFHLKTHEYIPKGPSARRSEYGSDETFASITIWRRHLWQSHTEPDMPPRDCPLKEELDCTFSTAVVAALNEHVREIHKQIGRQ